MTHPIPAAALEQHIGVLGKTGSGKSYAAQGIAEDLIEKKRRVCIIDPTDRYWGLRLLADGKNPSGYEPVIFGGQHADLPVAATHGAALAEIAGTTTTPIIISTRLMTVGERSRFFTDFAETLLRKNEGPLHLIVDEAHLFAPQTKVQSIESGKLLHASNNLVSLGRGIGLRIMLLSQRPAKLHKDSLTQVETLVAFRLIAPQDRNAIKEWVKEWADEATGAEMMSSLPSLPTGTAWVWAPELDVLRKGTFPPNNTYDSGKPLAAGRKGPALAPIDLAKVAGKLEIVAKEAIENDPRRLKARIAELERELKVRPQMHEKAAIDAAFTNGRLEGFAEGTRQQALADRDEIRKRQAAIDKALGYLAPLAKREDGNAIIDVPRDASPLTIDARPRQPSPRRLAAPPPRRAGNGASEPMPKAERSFLTVLAQRNRPLTRNQIAIFAGYSVKSGHIDNTLSALRSKGWASGGNDAVQITEDGLRALGAYDALPIGEALRQHWLGELDKAGRTFLAVLFERYPGTLTRAEIAEAAGYSVESGHVDNTLSKLRSLELAEGRNDAIKASDELFEGG